MGRVYEALKRAAEHGNANPQSTDETTTAATRRAAAKSHEAERPSVWREAVE